MSEYVPNMQDLIEAFAFDESKGRGVKHGELTTGPASRRFREAKELAEQAVAAEIRRAKTVSAEQVSVALAEWDCHTPDPDKTLLDNMHDAMGSAFRAAGLLLEGEGDA